MQKGEQAGYAPIGHWVQGGLVPGRSGRYAPVFTPATGAQAHILALASDEEIDEAVSYAKAAQSAWAATNPQRRARVMMRFLELCQRDYEEIAHLISQEHGKTLADARGDLQRGLEVVEFAAGIPHLLKGEYSDGVGPGIDMYALRQPLGVVAGITPFNFPVMIPLWKAAPAIACGNAFLLKPSERVPSAPLKLAALWQEAGLPGGIFQVVNGDKQAVDALLRHLDIAAVGFVGSSSVAQYVYQQAAATGKRVQAFGGAKNHMIIMPDADIARCVDALIGAAYGSAGERCMAISAVLPVGEETAERLLAELLPRIAQLRVGASLDPAADFGPLISRAHWQKVKEYIDLGVEEGAELRVDGRGFRLQGYEQGFYMGASLFDQVAPHMRIYREEIFGPVLCCVRVHDYETALALASQHEYGNGVALFTQDGGIARDFVSRVNVGMVGVNVPIPVPLGYYSFGGWKRSCFGDLNQHGPDAIRFYTKTKTVTARWFPSPLAVPHAGAAHPPSVKVETARGADFVIPTMG
jgi:malonate-semialdehyde dehydrogenase (acetylating) / methylmalonate-semialdehyde dehydrogenase